MKVLETRSKNIATKAQGRQVIQENNMSPFSSCLARLNDCRSVGRGDIVAGSCSAFEALDKLGNRNFSQRWERGKVSLLLLTFSHPSVVERWYSMAVVKECHEGHEVGNKEHAYVPKRSTSACRHEDKKENLEMVVLLDFSLNKKSCLGGKNKMYVLASCP